MHFKQIKFSKTSGSNSTLLKLFLFYIISQIAYGFEFLARVSVSQTTINTFTEYTLELSRKYSPLLTKTLWDTELVTAGSNITVKFPSDFDLRSSPI